MFVYLNGAVVDESEARVPVSDRGFLLGDGLFETMRAYGVKVFRLGAHLARLRASAAFFHIPWDTTDDAVAGIIADLIARNACPDAYVRLTLTRGPLAKGLRLDGGGRPTALVTARPMTPYPDDLYRKGARLIVSSIRVHSASPLPRHKTLNYLPYLLARQEADDAGETGALILNEHGQVTEESVANVFYVLGGKLHTPPAHCGLLPGITRSVVMELAARESFGCSERPLPAGEVFDCDEVFLTNSLMEVLPVRAVDGRRIGAETPGAVTRRARELFQEAVARETGSGQ